MARPHIIIHTHTSIDGNINAGHEPASQKYQDLALRPGTQQFQIDAYLNGKTSTEDNVTHGAALEVDARARVPAGDHIAQERPAMRYISIDPRGELAWPESTVDYGGVEAHVLEVLSEAASDGYKDFLRRRGISYVIAGQHQIDYDLLLQKLHALGIERLMIGGGGAINWSFLQQGLVDEVSVVLAPVANADPEAPRYFTAREPYSTIDLREFTLTSVQDLGDSVVWLRYTPAARA